ncbi:AraC-type sugar metabolism regulator, partial [gut metagenome]
LMKEGKVPGYGSNVLRRGILAALLVLVLRAAILADQNRGPCKRTQFMVGDVFIYIQEHLSEKLTLQSFENAFYVSHEHIAREFKRQTGQSLHQYILAMRIERACELLRQGLSASKVWPQCGFGSASYFFQAFHKRCGMTPMEYVKKQQATRQIEKERQKNYRQTKSTELSP